MFPPFRAPWNKQNNVFFPNPLLKKKMSLERGTFDPSLSKNILPIHLILYACVNYMRAKHSHKPPSKNHQQKFQPRRECLNAPLVDDVDHPRPRVLDAQLRLSLRGYAVLGAFPAAFLKAPDRNNSRQLGVYMSQTQRYRRVILHPVQGGLVAAIVGTPENVWSKEGEK